VVGDLARVVVGAAFVIAAVAKLVQGRRWVAQATSAGVPGPVAAAVPWVELTVGATTVAGVAEPWPAVAALVLLGSFTVWIVWRLASGDDAPCACFGAVSASPLSRWDVIRNGVLLALAVVAVAMR
jgi:uncharacterized membrane protein YphA (DoxX/SURF4 family)